MIAELQEERQRLDEAIEALERLSASNRGHRPNRLARGAKRPDQLPQPIDDKASSVYHSRDRKADHPSP